MRSPHIFITAGGIVMLGAMLPWATVLGFISVSGLAGDGRIIFALGLVLVIIGIYTARTGLRTGLRFAALIVAGLAAMLGTVIWVSAQRDTPSLVTIGLGLPVVIVGGVVGVVGAMLGITHEPDPKVRGPSTMGGRETP